LAVKINGNRGAEQEISDSTKVSKAIVPFQHEFSITECDIKNDPIRFSESQSDTKIRLPVLLGIRLHPKNSDSLRVRFRNPGSNCRFSSRHMLLMV